MYSYLPQGVRTPPLQQQRLRCRPFRRRVSSHRHRRALYKDALFVILDEPTAALDPIAEAEIYEQFSQMTAGKNRCLHLPPHEQLQILRPHHRPRPRPHRRRRNPRHPSSQTTASTPIFTKPRPNTTPESSPSRPHNVNGESETQPLQFVLRTSGLCFSGSPPLISGMQTAPHHE